MSALVIDGKALAKKVKTELTYEIEGFFQQKGRSVTLAVVLVGENPASLVYVRNKKIACEEVGIRSLEIQLSASCTQEDAEQAIVRLSNDDAVDGILVQLPLPAHLDEKKLLSLIPEEKDVDGFLPANMGKLLRGEDSLVPCTPAGVIEMLKSTGVAIQGKHAVIVGRSNIVGKPLALLLLKENATITVCHSQTEGLAELCRCADILIAAVGRPHFITAEMVKNGATVIDVGISRVDGKIVGDVDFAAVTEKAGFISPVPGGVGPMTVAMLLRNTVSAAFRRNFESIC